MGLEPMRAMSRFTPATRLLTVNVCFGWRRTGVGTRRRARKCPRGPEPRPRCQPRTAREGGPAGEGEGHVR
eukprot:scaffold6168_cov79-Isochrysis_galbana.AAC.1